MPKTVRVTSEGSKYGQTISVGSHLFHADEPGELGGKDEGPTSIELLLAALGACANITVQMYAERKQWPLRGVDVNVSCQRLLMESDNQPGAKIEMVDQVDIDISLEGELSQDQRDRLFEIANRCPVHRMLVSQVRVCARLLAPDGKKLNPPEGRCSN